MDILAAMNAPANEDPGRGKEFKGEVCNEGAALNEVEIPVDEVISEDEDEVGAIGVDMGI